MESMPRVLLTTTLDKSLLARQTPQGMGRWDDFQFLFQPDGDPVDAWVVYDDLEQPVSQLCPPANTLLITGRPASLRQYRTRYTSQFGQVWTSHTQISHPHATLRFEAQPWRYGIAGATHGQALGFEELQAVTRPEKHKLLSVLCSAKSVTADHRRRLEFVRCLQAEFGSQIDVFGYGVNPVADKSLAILPYKYHIALESDHSDQFMSEKLPDAFLGWCYPIYFGGKEAYHRFPEGSFTAIDIYQPETALNVIRNVLASETYEQSLDRIAEARHWVLTKHNLFAMLAEYWRANLVQQSSSQVTLLPKAYRTTLVVQQLKRSLTRRAA
jgi:Glycosyltransferase family 10 (fucosyltransferase) C-term